MLDSLRVRLLVWYGLILVLIILTFGTTICYLVWRSTLQSIDRDLQSASTVILQALRPAAPGDFDFDFDLPRQYRELEFTQRTPHTYFALFNRQGMLIDRSDADVAAVLSAAPGAATRGGKRELIVSGTNGATTIVGRDLSEARHQVLSLAGTIAAAGGVALLLSLLGGWFLAGRALAPISRISRAATAMSRGDLSARIPIAQTESELEQLAVTLNDAFDRLRFAADVQRRFTADASHELRTPLATIAAEFEWAVARPRDAADYRRTIDTCRRASDRMRGIIDELLRLARNDGGLLQLRRETIDLPLVIRGVVSELGPLVEERRVTVVTLLESVWILGDPNQIGQLIVNLVKNAIEYNRDGGQVTIATHARSDDVQLSIADSGIGIAADDVPHIFERFYRADKARSRRSGGAGLGLAIAKRIVHEHRGTLSCASELGQGTTITVTFLRSPS
jgi:two-component system, OmpR family, sensor kinase